MRFLYFKKLSNLRSACVNVLLFRTTYENNIDDSLSEISEKYLNNILVKPNGNKILFASNREAYQRTLSQAEQRLFDDDSSYFMDLYIMDADGSNLEQLTFSPGYDGGPFFSADDQKIVWRRFNPDGNSAEIWTMDVDGSNQRQLTAEAMVSWGPYFHPSGDYIIYSSNVLGNSNFELFIVDLEGQHEPVRVTNTEGTDILPVFSPDGTQLAWSSTRTSDESSQIFMADWNDRQAREMLGLGNP